MPKITVTERDLSWYYRQRDPSALTVYMPILASQGPTVPTLCDATNFKSTYGATSTGVPGDISYDMAASFVEVGISVLAHRVVPNGATSATAVIISREIDTVATPIVTARVKSPGTAGNAYKIKGQKVSGTEYKFFVQNQYGISLIASVDFADTTSSNYYAKVNETSDFIEFIVAEGQTVLATDALVSDQYISFAGGTDYGAGQSPTDVKAAVVAAISLPGFFDALKDPYQYTFDIAVDGGFNDLTKDSTLTALSAVDSAFANENTGLVNVVKDAIYLASGVSGMEPQNFFAYCDNFKTSFAAGYGPWGYAQLTSNGSVELLPGYYAMLIAWGNSIASGNPVWLAPAGVKRSQLGTFYRKPEYEISKTILDTWQNQEDISSEVDYKVNPIMKLRQYGYCVYGNSTLLKSGANASSMLQSFSIRVLANQIKKQAFDISLTLQFDQLTPDLFVQFRELLSVYMDQLKYGGALYDYEIVADYSTLTDAQLNTKTVPVIIRISPNPAAENFDITLEISQAGVSFTDDTETTTTEEA